MAHTYYKKLRKAGTLDDLKIRLWRAVDSAENLLEQADKPDAAARAIHALVQAGQAYGRVLMGAELEARVKALEEAQKHFQPNGIGLKKVI